MIIHEFSVRKMKCTDYTIHRRPYISITESRGTHSSTLVSRLKLPAHIIKSKSPAYD